MSLLQALTTQAVLRPVDVALANTLQRLAPATPDAVLAAAALATLAVAQGHAALDVTQPHLLTDVALAWPDAQAWQQQLVASPWVATPNATSAEAAAAPLVFEHGLLYLRRYREYERRLALRLQHLSAQRCEGTEGANVDALFAQLFPQRGAPDTQAHAAALALRHALVLITGGPGTGKTTTIARLLVLRIAQALHAGKPLPRIAMTAPTGRAAERMAESLQRAVQQMRNAAIDPTLLAALPSTASTLHRLLGVIPDAPQFRHHADNPLACDIVMVDEASMVDLPLMCKLAEAVADDAQLILLGDPDQLPSVEAGDVLASILRLHTNRVHLSHGWRQSEQLHLAPLAEAMRNGDAATSLALLRGGNLSNVHFHEASLDPLSGPSLGPSLGPSSDPLPTQRLDLLAHFRQLAMAADPAAALASLNQVRLLTALRDGPQGARGLNARIEARLLGQRVGHAPTWFPGRLVLITENNYRHNLFNGDVGICLPDTAGHACVWFASSDGVRGFHPASLPAHESAFAMTVHKAQGSEFDSVYLQLPARDARVLSRELLYTAITRARKTLHIAGNAVVISTALARHANRVSGLAARLA